MALIPIFSMSDQYLKSFSSDATNQINEINNHLFKAHFATSSKITGKVGKNKWHNQFYLNIDTDSESDILQVQIS